MTVSDTVRTLTVPQQAAPADPPLAPRPLSAEERQFVLALAAMVVVLGTIIVAGLLLAQYAWS